MIDSLTLKFGPSQSSDPLAFELTPLTIIIGPNNSGKSRFLKEIEYNIFNTTSPDYFKIIDTLELHTMNSDEIDYEVSIIEKSYTHESMKRPGEVNIPYYKNGMVLGSSYFNIKDLKSQANNLSENRDYFKFLMRKGTLRLDGKERLNLINSQDAGDLLVQDENNIKKLFLNDPAREKWRQVVYDAFKLFPLINPTTLGKLNVSFSLKEPKLEFERSLTDESINFFKTCIPSNNVSDGVKVFTGILSILYAQLPYITLLDEPEAFLHPGLSYKLGNEIGKALRGSKSCVIASTHSSDFLLGSVQSGIPLNILRLEFKSNVPTARLLSKEKIIPLMRNPLLRSTGVLQALFYESVVVTEGDADRAFYQEINERLLAANDPRGIRNCLFINAQNKQTIWTIVKPLRELGIPSVGIVDIDMLKDGGIEFTNILNSAQVPSLTYRPMQAQRDILNKTLTAIDKDFKKNGGIGLLSRSDKTSALDFFDSLSKYGVFVVKNGELESWLKHFRVTAHGPKWLITMFEKMGEDIDDINYVKPTNNDVWEFIGEINNWFSNPHIQSIDSK